MFWRILKKDLRRKKTMNVILLLFVVLSAMFAAASINNIIAVNGGIDQYFELAEVPDAVVQIQEKCDAEDRIRALPSVSSVKTEHWHAVMSSKVFIYKGKPMNNFFNPACIMTEDEMAIKYFDENNDVITDVEKGCFYATAPFSQDMDLKIGDQFKMEVDDVQLDLKYMGRLKDALSSSDSASGPMLLFPTRTTMRWLTRSRSTRSTSRHFLLIPQISRLLGTLPRIMIISVLVQDRISRAFTFMI